MPGVLGYRALGAWSQHLRNVGRKKHLQPWWKSLRCWYLMVMLDVDLVDSVDVLLGMSCAECCGPFLLPHAILQHPDSLMLIQSHHSHHETIMVCPVLLIHDVAISWAHPGTWQVGKVGQIGLNNMSGSVSSVGVRCFLFDVCKVRSYWKIVLSKIGCATMTAVLSWLPLMGGRYFITVLKPWNCPFWSPQAKVLSEEKSRKTAFYRDIVKKDEGKCVDPFLVSKNMSQMLVSQLTIMNSESWPHSDML